LSILSKLTTVSIKDTWRRKDLIISGKDKEMKRRNREIL
jgi:hypothetical protein